MRTKEEIKEIVQQNIDQIKISEFVTEGGWPNIDNVDVIILNQKIEQNIEVVSLQILYTLSVAGCCFIPGREDYRHLTKIVSIFSDKVIIE